MPTPRTDDDAPVTPPRDVDEERARLLRDVESLDLTDQAEALRLVGQVAHVMPLPDAYRAVDRRLATGYSVEEAGRILQGDPDAPTSPAADD